MEKKLDSSATRDRAMHTTSLLPHFTFVIILNWIIFFWGGGGGGGVLPSKVKGHTTCVTMVGLKFMLLLMFDYISEN